MTRWPAPFEPAVGPFDVRLGRSTRRPAGQPGRSTPHGVDMAESRRVRCGAALSCVAVAAVGWLALAVAARGDGALTAADVLRFLRAGISEHTILLELQTRGFGEPLDDTREASLRAAGASETLVVALRRAATAGARHGCHGSAAGQSAPPREPAGPRLASCPPSRTSRRSPRTRARCASRSRCSTRRGSRCSTCGRELPRDGQRAGAGGLAVQPRAAAAAHRAGARHQQEHGQQDPPGGGGADALRRHPRAPGPDPRDDVQPRGGAWCRTSRRTARRSGACSTRSSPRAAPCSTTRPSRRSSA